MAHRKKIPLPEDGEAFAVPLADGRYSVCRVLCHAEGEQARHFGEPSVLVACSAWIGSEIPDVDDPELRSILHLTHHTWPGDPELLWLSDPVPEEFVPIGSIQPTAEDKSLECLASGGWQSMSLQPLLQWNWDHDRQTVLEEDERRKAAEIEQRTKANQNNLQQPAKLTLEELSDHKFFQAWGGCTPVKALRASRKIMKNTVRDLSKLDPSASENDRMAVLQNCIESFNTLDGELQFIDTIEREDICEEFEMIAQACGLGGHENMADEWRDW
ncbi:MAG: hypothetical protein HN350_19945 [Phycisphaerales bacterium]|jgi:hypothetical protein|nr:hypothetical protein [Phycisphaerales bacterium]